MSLYQQDKPCWLAECDGCGDPLGNDEFSSVHFEEEGEAKDYMRLMDWTIQDGRTLCEGCSEPDEPLACEMPMVGSGTDTYDPTCELPLGHAGSCKSTAAIDQHRLTEEEKHAAWANVAQPVEARLYGVPAGMEDAWPHVAVEDVRVEDVVQWQGRSYIVASKKGRKLNLERLGQPVDRFSVEVPAGGRLQIARKP